MCNKSLVRNYAKSPKQPAPRKKKDSKSEEVADDQSTTREGLNILQKMFKRVQSYGGQGKRQRHVQLKKKHMRRKIKGDKKK